MGRPSWAIVLAEDRRHQRFVRYYLNRLRYREIRYIDLPSGRGCREQWVRERYAREVKAYRDRSARAGTALVVAIDADKGDINRRLSQLSHSLSDEHIEARGPDERIVHLIPKRSVETWVLCLAGQRVDEETDYSRRDVGMEIPAAAEEFFEWSRPNRVPPPYCIPSLREALPEVRRLE
jgi:hypothetical protein